MRIAYIGPVPPRPGGISHSGAALCAALRRAGHDVEIISWSAQYPRFLYPGSQHDPDATAPAGARFPLRWWAPWGWWVEARRARAVDLVVFPWVSPAQAPAYWTILAATRGVPRIAVVHNPHPHESRRYDDAAARSVLRRVDTLLTHSEAAAKAVAELAPDIPVVAAPIAPTVPVQTHPLPPRPPVRTLFFGMVRAYKGVDLALDALAILRRRGVEIELTIAGELWDETVEQWRSRIDGAGLRDAVELRPGYVPDADVDALFAAHHLVLAPYRTATQSAVVPVAAAAGRPTVATPVGGLAEQVVDGVNGTIASDVTAIAFADAVARAIADLDALAARAAGTAGTAPSWDEVARRVESAATAISRRRQPPSARS
jgi:glycosyltransferase involved in cell wall biosynthesis